MKYLIVSICLMIILSNFSLAQQIGAAENPSQNPDYDNYMLRYKKQKKTANTLLISGVLTFGVGGIMYANAVNNSFNSVSSFANSFAQVGAGVGFMTLGGILTAASIPVYISAGGNKKKANLSLNTQIINLNSPYYSLNYPTLTFSYKL